jgi:hypothetical protein
VLGAGGVAAAATGFSVPFRFVAVSVDASPVPPAVAAGDDVPFVPPAPPPPLDPRLAMMDGIIVCAPHGWQFPLKPEISARPTHFADGADKAMPRSRSMDGQAAGPYATGGAQALRLA